MPSTNVARPWTSAETKSTKRATTRPSVPVRFTLASWPAWVELRTTKLSYEEVSAFQLIEISDREEKYCGARGGRGRGEKGRGGGQRVATNAGG